MTPVSPPKLSICCEYAQLLHSFRPHSGRHVTNAHPPTPLRSTLASVEPAPPASAALLIGAAGAGAWWFLKDDAPAEVDLQTATFVLTEPIELGDAVTSGETVTVSAVGELTIHGVTTAVTIPLEAQLVDGTIVVVGSLDVTFSDYGVSVPSAPIVVSAEDNGVIELQLLFAQA
jgi:YceI-like domain